MVRIVPSEPSNSNSLTFSDGKAEGEDRDGNDKRESKNNHTLAQENMEMDEIEEFLDAEDWSSPGGNHADSVSSEQDSASQLRHASFLDRLSAGGSANSAVNSEIGSVAGSHDNEIATNIQPELEDEGEVRDQGHGGNLMHSDIENVYKATLNPGLSLLDDKDVEAGTKCPTPSHKLRTSSMMQSWNGISSHKLLMFS